MTRWQRFGVFLKDAGCWLVRVLGLALFLVFDFVWSVGFAIAVWLLSDLHGIWKDWQWRRRRRRAEAMKEHGIK